MTDSLFEMETRVSGLDALPHSLALLREAIETITAAIPTGVRITMDGNFLRAERKSSHWNVRVEGGIYHLYYMCQGDSWDAPEESTSNLAWQISGAWRPSLKARVNAFPEESGKPKDTAR